MRLAALLTALTLGCTASPIRPLTPFELDQIHCIGVARGICPRSIRGCAAPVYDECMALLGWRIRAGKYTKEEI